MKHLLAAWLITVALASAAVPAFADDQRLRIRGTIAGVSGDTLTIATTNGSVPIALAANTRIVYIVKSDFSAIKPGVGVGTAAVAGPNGTLRAREVHIFPAGSTPNVGTSAWDSEPGASMTNAPVTTIADAKVDAVGGHVLTVTLPSGDKQILVGADTPITTTIPADRSALTAGAHAIVFVVKHDDGSQTISAVQVGQNGLVPRM